MIKLIQDCKIAQLFNKGVSDASQRYWYFSAYNGPSYDFLYRDDLSAEECDLIVEDFLHPKGNFIDLNKFDSAFPFFALDEWTSIIGFKANPDKALEVYKFIDDNEMSPEDILKAYPDSDVCGFYWIAGWWEAFGRENILDSLIQDSLVSLEVLSSEYISSECDVDLYRSSREKLSLLVASRRANSSNKQE